MTEDWTYKQGQFSRVFGSFGIMTNMNKQVGALLKVVVNDVDTKTLNMTPSKPADAYLVSKNFETNKAEKISSTASDMPGAIVSPLKPRRR